MLGGLGSDQLKLLDSLTTQVYSGTHPSGIPRPWEITGEEPDEPVPVRGSIVTWPELKDLPKDSLAYPIAAEQHQLVARLNRVIERIIRTRGGASTRFS